MDYKALLIKYIQHVDQVQSTVCLTDLHYKLTEVDFTPEEWAELEALALVAREME